MLSTNGLDVYISCISIWPLCKNYLIAIWLVPVSLGQPCFVLVWSGPITSQEKCIQKWISAELSVVFWQRFYNQDQTKESTKSNSLLNQRFC